MANLIAFSARFSAPAGDIFTSDLVGGTPVPITSEPTNDYDPTWSPDGLSIAYRSAPSANAGEQGRSDIKIVDAATGAIRTLVGGADAQNWSPSWSPDGEWIAYSDQSDKLSLRVIRPDGTGDREVLAGDAEYPSWSPDSQTLVFMSLGFPPSSSSAGYDLYRVNIDGSGLRRLTTAVGEDGWPAWSHDGQSIAYTHAGGPGFDIHVMDTDGNGDRAITDAASIGFSYDYPDWSPSDTYLAISAYPQSEQSTMAGGMFIVRPDGTGILRIATDGVSPVWRP